MFRVTSYGLCVKNMSNKTKVAIIGFGNFGTLAASILSKDFEVLIHHYRDREEDIAKAERIGAKLIKMEEIGDCDVVILSTPISETEKTIKELMPHLKSGALLLDTCSVKVYPCEWLKKHARDDIEILGTHPMFGPTTSKFNFEEQKWTLEGLQIVLCPLRVAEDRVKNIEKYLEGLGLKIITTSPEDHDRQNAKTLSFVHFVGRSLLASGIGHQEIYTPGYIDLLSILPHTTSDNWQLFYDMNNYNPYSDELRENFRDAGLEIEEKIIRNRGESEMDQNRELIDLIDQRLMKLLEKRFECSKRIGDYKKEKGLEVVDPAREEEIINKKVEMSSFDKNFVAGLYRLVFDESYKFQK